jgi:HSP20 family protein
MPRDKRSFLERLTGSISLTEDETPEERPKKISIQGEKEHWLEEEAEEGELSVDVYQTPTEIVIQTMVAGVKPEDLNISITREMVTLQGRRDRPTEVDEGNYFQKELYWGSFSRTILLPHEVETEEADAIEKHGLLTLRLPKIDKAKIQKVRVKSI